MQVDLEAGTDVATFVIFDPATIDDHDVPGKWTDVDPTLAAWSADGRVLEYSYAGDGGACFRVFVDEEPPAE